MQKLQRQIHANAVKHGWWEKPDITEKLLMIHTEVSEAVEDYRDSKMEVTLAQDGKPEGFPTELADIMIRTMDLAEYLGIDLHKEIITKNAYNKIREYRHGNKRC